MRGLSQFNGEISSRDRIARAAGSVILTIKTAREFHV
jgi:hypothetical protein